MKTSIFRFSVLTLGLLALLGQGCKPATPATPSQPEAEKAKPAATLGFGKLPKLAPPEAPQAGASASAAPAPGAESAAPSAPPPLASGEAGEAAGVSEEAKTMTAPGVSAPSPTAVRPVPIPVPKPRPVTVEYLIEGQMPSWGKEGDVLLAKRRLPNAATVGAFAKTAGLPAEVTGGIAEATSLNFQWKDRDGFIWTYDAANRAVSLYKESPYDKENSETKPSFDEAETLKAANDFLDAHGFAAIRQRGGMVQDLPQFLPLMKGSPESSMPCIMEGEVRAEAGASGSGPATAGQGVASPQARTPAEPVSKPQTGGVVMPSIYPSPCWWPIQANVTYPGEREGRKIADTYGADVNTTNIAVDLRTKQVVNGYIQLDEDVERSSYPLIDQETARRRLQSGGRNPIWPWGNETGNIKVHLKTLELVWMRYDVWQDGTSDTYYLPGLRAPGSVDRGAGTEPEEYRTTIPLLADDTFEDAAPPGPVPLPMGVPEKE